jgi:hypothetical protein
MWRLVNIAKTIDLRTVWRYQKVNQKPLIDEGQTIQWLKEMGHNDKQRSTKHYTEN